MNCWEKIRWRSKRWRYYPIWRYGSGFKNKFFLDTDGCDDEEANGIVYTEQTEVLTNTAPEEKVKVIFNLWMWPVQYLSTFQSGFNSADSIVGL